MASNILVHPLTSNPSAAWVEMQKQQKVIRLNVKTPTDPPSDNMVIICL